MGSPEEKGGVGKALQAGEWQEQRQAGRQEGQEAAAGCMQGMARHWVWKTAAAVTAVGLGTVPLRRTGIHTLIFFERFFLNKILFIYYFWLPWVFIARCRLSLAEVNGGWWGSYSSFNVWASHRSGVSCCGAWAREAPGLQGRLSRRGAQP